MELSDALNCAVNVKSFLAPYCKTMEIAGSVRRGAQRPKDLELVVIPKMIPGADLFDGWDGYSAIESAPITRLGKIIKNGQRYKQIDLGDLVLDLFIVFPPAQFGVIFLIRTGPADFSKFMVTRKSNGGALPDNCRSENGVMLQDGKMIAMPEEKDYFNFCGMSFIEPEKRENERIWKQYQKHDQPENKDRSA